MIRSPLLYLLWGVVTILSGCREEQFGTSTTLPIESGVVNLENYDLENQAPIRLNGEWEFYWEKLLSPQDFKNPSLIKPDAIISFPSYWNKVQLPGKGKGGYGYATYRLKVKNIAINSDLAIKMRNAMTSYRIWVNDELLMENGQVGTNMQETKPGFFPNIEPFRTDRDQLEIVLQISNFSHAKGGMRGDIILGGTSQVHQIREKNVIFDIFLVGVIFIMSIYHFGLFYLLRNDSSTLYFGLLCFVVALRVFSTGEITLTNYFDLSWKALQKIEYITFVSALPVFLLFIRVLYPKRFSSYFMKTVNIIAGVLILLILMTSSSVYSFIAVPYQFLVVISGIYVFYILYQSFKKEDTDDYGTMILLIGYLILFGTIIYDVLYYNFLSQKGYLTPFGLFIFIFFQSFLLSKRFSKAYKLIEENSSILEQKVIERTVELEQKNKSLKQLNKEKDSMIDIVAHDLKAPFNKIKGFSELIKLSGELNDEQEEYLNHVNNMVRSGTSLVHDILDMNAYSYDDFKLNPKEINLKGFISEWKQSYSQWLMSKNQKLLIKIEDDVALTIDNDLFTRIIDNLLSNAIKFSSNGKNIWLNAIQQDHTVKISIKDEGPGFSEEDKKLIYNRFQKLSAQPTSGESSNGLGLSIIKTLVAKLNGEIILESKPGEGTKFTLIFPVKTT